MYGTRTTAATPIAYKNQNPIFTKPFCIITRRPTLSHKSTKPPKPSSLLAKCTNTNNPQESENRRNNISSSSLNDALSGVVNEQVEELLNREENRALLDGLEKASLRVENARRELALIERQEVGAQELRNYIDRLESRALEIEKCQREISEARAMVEEAERSLSLDTNKDGDGTDTASGEINRDEERLESVKAASISALIGTLAGLPIYITQVSDHSELILPLAITCISCALFGVTFRYAVRRDLDNFQLKSGTSAAFGFVKGLGTLSGGPPLELNAGSLLSHGFDGAVHVAENLLIFGFAAVSLDLCFKLGLLSPFPVNKSASSTDTE